MGSTTVTASCTYQSREVCDAIIADGMESGASESYDRRRAAPVVALATDLGAVTGQKVYIFWHIGEEDFCC